jgi:hypothetical protein
MRSAIVVCLALCAIPLTGADRAAAAEAKRGRVDYICFCMNPQASQWVGLSAAHVNSGSIGLFAQLLFSWRSKDYYDNISSQLSDSWGDPVRDNVERAISGAIGPSFGLGSSVVVYSGVGYSAINKYQQRYDPMHILGTNGQYWIGAGDSFNLQLTGGLLARVSPSSAIQIGYSSKPSGMVIGFGAAIGATGKHGRPPGGYEPIEPLPDLPRPH